MLQYNYRKSEGTSSPPFLNKNRDGYTVDAVNFKTEVKTDGIQN